MRRHSVSLTFMVGLLAALLVAGSAGAAPLAGRVTGTVGPGFTISVSKKKVAAGRYRITIRDRSDIHNFRLRGRGVNRATGVRFRGTVVWNVRLRAGTYRFVCDPHASTMKGILRVR